MPRGGRGRRGVLSARGRSVLRRVHGARIVGVLYGQRALLMQATHPLAFAGLIANTSGLEAPFKRLVHTATTMETVFFGTRDEADREYERVRDLHSHVRGAIERRAGPHPAGAAYRADDPVFLLWILACLADSAQAAYEGFVRRLSDREREAYWADYLTVGELFGLAREDAPPTYAAYRAYIDERLASEDLHVTDEARELGRTVAFEMPVPAHREPALAVINFAVLGLLPGRVRELYGLEWDRSRQAAFDALRAGLRVSARFTPARVRRGSSVRDYDIVARAEPRRLAGSLR
ncbi:MAG: oxygenase MpaB family protein [Solirubrobacterales bacterium]